MKLTKSDRSRALRISSAVVTGYKPERDEVELIAQTVCDCAAVFQVHAPVIAAAKKCIDARGNVSRDYAQIFQDELVPAVRALHRHDAAMSKEETP